MGQERVQKLSEEEEPFYGYKYLPRKFKVALTGRAPDKYNLYLEADFSGQRMNRLYRENIDTGTILRELRPLFRTYQKGREAGERFGDFLMRVGIVEKERTSAMLHQPLK